MADALQKRCVKSDHGAKLVKPGVYHPRSKNPHHSFPKYKNTFKRAVFKNGEFNDIQHNPNKKFNFSTSWFVVLVQTRWRWTLFSYALAFIGNWLFFGTLYMIISMGHGDFNDNINITPNETEWTPCIRKIYNFTSAFLFSIEVHTTVAYGHRKITLECPEAIFTMCMQCIVSSIFQAFMVGILFAKLTRPKGRTQTILFSKNAVVNSNNDKMCLIFRVGDMRKSRILNIKALMYIIRLESDFDHLEEFEQISLDVEMDGCESTFFLWPVSVIHVIDKESPLYKISAADLLTGNLEILVVFEGTIESTGQPVQARSSYTSSEILWGHRFVQMVNYDFDKKLYNVDFSKLSMTEQVDTPLCSVAEFESIVSEIN